MAIETFDDVCQVIVPLTVNISERDLRDIILTIHNDPSTASALEASYRAANADTPEGTVSKAWEVITAAASTASVITSLIGLGTAVASL